MAFRWRHKNHFKWHFVLASHCEPVFRMSKDREWLSDFEVEEIIL